MQGAKFTVRVPPATGQFFKFRQFVRIYVLHRSEAALLPYGSDPGYFMLGPLKIGNRVSDRVGLHRHRVGSALEYLEYKGKPAL